jgi:hypothetical protein
VGIDVKRVVLRLPLESTEGSWKVLLCFFGALGNSQPVSTATEFEGTLERG